MTSYIRGFMRAITIVGLASVARLQLLQGCLARYGRGRCGGVSCGPQDSILDFSETLFSAEKGGHHVVIK
jgi:hypothetical protein